MARQDYPCRAYFTGDELRRNFPLHEWHDYRADYKFAQNNTSEDFNLAIFVSYINNGCHRGGFYHNNPRL